MSSTLTQISSDRPLAHPKVIDRLFVRLISFYGNKFGDAFGGISIEDMKVVWAEELAGYSLDELNSGVVACRSLPWPPTLPEFLGHCRAALDPEVAFYEALENQRLRDEGINPRYSHPAVFHAANAIGTWDMNRAGFKGIKARWQHALRTHMERRDLAPVPPPMKALPAPAGGPPSPVIAARLRGLVQTLKGALAPAKDATSGNAKAIQ